MMLLTILRIGILENDDWLVSGFLLTSYRQSHQPGVIALVGGVVWGLSRTTFAHCFQLIFCPIDLDISKEVGSDEVHKKWLTSREVDQIEKIYSGRGFCEIHTARKHILRITRLLDRLCFIYRGWCFGLFFR